MDEFENGDLVYVKQEIREAGFLISQKPPVSPDRVGVAARIEYIAGEERAIASIIFEYDGERAIVNASWLGHWKDFATIEEVEDYLDE